MARSRLLIVSIITGAALFGVPLPTHAGPRFPATLEKALEAARNVTLRPSATGSAALIRDVFALPMRANLVAVSFAGAKGDQSAIARRVQVLAHFRSAGTWSSWQRLSIEEDGPDTSLATPPSSRTFTIPLWVGTADAMGVRVISLAKGPVVRDIRIHLINTLGDAVEPNLLQRVSAAVARFLRGSQAEAIDFQPKIITRQQWGADESWRECCPRYAPSVQLAFVHHTAGTNDYTASQSAAIVRGIYRYHTKTEGWSDIGYNFLVDRYGQIFEGRYGGMTSPVIGAHTRGFNAGSTGVSLMGNFSSVSPPSAMLHSLEYLLAWKLDVHHIPPTGTVVMTSSGNEKYAAGTRVTLNRIAGHRDGQSTSCPGSDAYALLPSIRSAVSKIGLPKMYQPSISAPLLRPDGDGVNDTITVRGTFTQVLYWRITFGRHDGTVIRRLTGRGSSFAATWDGRADDGTYSHSGVTDYTIEGYDGSARVLPFKSTFYMATDHPDGTLLNAPGGSYLLEAGKARPVAKGLVQASWFRASEGATVTDTEVARYPAGTPLGVRDGTVLTAPDGSHSIVSGGVRRQFASDAVFQALGYTAASALTATATEVAAIPAGAQITDATAHPAGAVVHASDGSVWTITGGVRQRNLNASVTHSWYRDAEVVPATAADLALATGDPWSFRQGTMFKAGADFWLYADGVKREFPYHSLYAVMGYADAGGLTVPSTDVASIPAGAAII